MKSNALTILLLLCATPSAMSHETSFAPGENPNEKRLIEIAPGKARWMSRKDLHQLSIKAHQAGYCGGYIDITNWKHPRRPLPRVRDAIKSEPNQHELVENYMKRIDTQALEKTVESLGGFHNRYYRSETGVNAAHWLRDQYKEIIQKSENKNLKVELFQHSDWPQPSVVATIPGQGARKNEIVVIGGHLDSINWLSPSSGRAPGMDDNASGTATVLEIFRVLANKDSTYRPERTLQFMGYAGEERGLLGSAEIARFYREKNYQVVGVIQFDMTMFPSKIREITMIKDPKYTDSDLSTFVEKLIDTYVQVPRTEDRCGYACSDHASWARAGYPAVMPFETTFDRKNPDIHTPRDDSTQLSSKWGTHFARLGVAFAIEMGTIGSQK